LSVLSETAPAKINLALHVRGKFSDGYHRIETIFAFCEDGDALSAEQSDRLSLNITGPKADGLPANETNLVLRAARALALAASVNGGARLSLDKRLPIASGIGGGSADAAAALRLLTRLWDIPRDHAFEVAPKLGADVLACLLSGFSRGTGAGDVVQPIDLPELALQPVLLVNPGVPLSTRDVFDAWDGEDRGPLGDWRKARNDLEPAAKKLVPQIDDVLDWLCRQSGAWVARMSGSGATCFALFQTEMDRDLAARVCPDHWWHLATRLR
jgi:4-diphosphocytidyl-2-C-methyl-D-erythritol kinase